jgi:hypothetical protein
MKKLEWVAVVAALGVGLGSEVLRHDHESSSGHKHDSSVHMESAEGVDQGSVVLAVRGMT